MNKVKVLLNSEVSDQNRITINAPGKAPAADSSGLIVGPVSLNETKKPSNLFLIALCRFHLELTPSLPGTLQIVTVVSEDRDHTPEILRHKRCDLVKSINTEAQGRRLAGPIRDQV